MLLVPPDPPLRAEGVVLRPFRRDDAASIVAACADGAILRFTFMKEGLDLPQAEQWIERGNDLWAVGLVRLAIVDASDRLLGQIGLAVDERHLSAEAFYWLAADARGRGIATRALTVMAGWAFDGGIERVFLLVHPENTSSHHVAERCGFTREGVLRAFEPFKGRRPDLVSWSLLPTDPRPPLR